MICRKLKEELNTAKKEKESLQEANHQYQVLQQKEAEVCFTV